MAALRGLPAPTEEAVETRDEALSYLTKRKAQIRYADFREQGYPIGSGMVESANKLVVEARLKGSRVPACGCHWERKNVTPMLALRGIACSGTWETTWPGIWDELRRAQVERRRTKQTERRAQRQARANAEQTAASPPPPKKVRPKTIVNGKLTDDHIWKKGYDQRLLARARAKT